MSFTEAPVFEIVRLIDLSAPGQGGFCVLITSPADRTLVSDLGQELEVQAGISLAVLDADGMTPDALLSQLRSPDAPVALVRGLDRWTDNDFASLDINRSRLETGTFLVFHLDPDTSARFLHMAPNLRSSIGASIFVAIPDTSNMSPQETAERLRELGEYYGMTDEQVIDRARDGTLPPDPAFAEWLVLLGKGDLVK
jgi:hypothetical protein